MICNVDTMLLSVSLLSNAPELSDRILSLQVDFGYFPEINLGTA